MWDHQNVQKNRSGCRLRRLNDFRLVTTSLFSGPTKNILTGHFTVLEPHNPPIDEFYAVQKRGWL